MEHHAEILGLPEELRIISKELQRIVMRMDNVYDQVSRKSPTAQFFVANMITQARRLRNNWTRYANNDRSILDDFDQWKDRNMFENMLRYRI